MNELYQIIRTSVKTTCRLLTLTVRNWVAIATLGIATISLQAGARSAVASLWRVDDPVHSAARHSVLPRATERAKPLAKTTGCSKNLASTA